MYIASTYNSVAMFTVFFYKNQLFSAEAGLFSMDMDDCSPHGSCQSDIFPLF